MKRFLLGAFLAALAISALSFASGPWPESAGTKPLQIAGPWCVAGGGRPTAGTNGPDLSASTWMACNLPASSARCDYAFDRSAGLYIERALCNVDGAGWTGGTFTLNIREQSDTNEAATTDTGATIAFDSASSDHHQTSAAGLPYTTTNIKGSISLLASASTAFTGTVDYCCWIEYR